MGGMIWWQGRALAYRPGDTLATALTRAGELALGQGPTGAARGMFCGIGQCQNCLVLVDGRPVEACLTPCSEGLRVLPCREGARHG